MRILRLFPMVSIAVLCACGDSEPNPADGGVVDAALIDAGNPSDGSVPNDASSGLDAGTSDSGSTDPNGTCAPGSQLVQYSLAAPATLPDVSEVNLPSLPSFVNLVPAGDGTENSARFTVCKDENGNHLLRSVLWNSWTFATPHSYVFDDTISSPVEEALQTNDGVVLQIRLPPANFIVQGLDQAIAGNLDGFEVRLVYDSGLLVLGHPTFVALAPGRVGVSSIEYTSTTVVIGTLEPGDVFAGLKCDFGEESLSASFTMGTADFEIDACTFLGGGETTGYRIYRLSIQDSNAALSVDEQQPFVFDGEAEVESVMNYVWNHHNACDSFYIALPHAEYAASVPPLAGCGAVVPNAPPRDFNDPPGGPVLYRIRYHGGAWIEGSIDGCYHYMFCSGG